MTPDEREGLLAPESRLAVPRHTSDGRLAAHVQLYNELVDRSNRRIEYIEELPRQLREHQTRSRAREQERLLLTDKKEGEAKKRKRMPSPTDRSLMAKRSCGPIDLTGDEVDGQSIAYRTASVKFEEPGASEIKLEDHSLEVEVAAAVSEPQAQGHLGASGSNRDIGASPLIVPRQTVNARNTTSEQLHVKTEHAAIAEVDALDEASATLPACDERGSRAPSPSSIADLRMLEELSETTELVTSNNARVMRAESAHE